jgi:hypothetical protein
VAPHLHFTENTLTLHLFLQRLERLIDVVVTNDDLYQTGLSLPFLPPGG